MSFKCIWLDRFRNFTGLRIQFSGGPVLVFGENNQGKTNFLESIYFLSHLNSPRESDALALIQFESDQAVLGADFGVGEGDHRVYIQLGRTNPMVVRQNDDPIRSMATYRRQFNTAWMTADVIRILTESPEYRRRDLGRFVAKQQVEYADLVARYQRIMRQRNQALTQGVSAQQMDIWNDPLSLLAADIVAYRLASISQLIHQLNQLAQQVIPQYLPIDIGYRAHGISAESGVIFTEESFSKSDYKARLISLLQSRFSREAAQGITTIGPHRDDIEFIANQRSVTQYYSRGINRSIAFLWKLAQLNLLGVPEIDSVLLMDEPFAEIDPTYRQRLVSLIDRRVQVIVATIDQSDYRYWDEPQILTVEAGQVK